VSDPSDTLRPVIMVSLLYILPIVNFFILCRNLENRRSFSRSRWLRGPTCGSEGAC